MSDKTKPSPPAAAIVLTLYVGTKKRGAKSKILTIVRGRFASFSVIQGIGFFRGDSEPMWLIKLATPAPLVAIETAEALQAALGQDGVGIEFAGQYYRVTKDDAASALRRLLLKRARRSPGKDGHDT